jgi:hypothetical protein
MHPISPSGDPTLFWLAARSQKTPYVLAVPEKAPTGTNAKISCHPPICPATPALPGAVAPDDRNLANCPGPSAPVPYKDALSMMDIPAPFAPPRTVNAPPLGADTVLAVDWYVSHISGRFEWNITPLAPKNDPS